MVIKKIRAIQLKYTLYYNQKHGNGFVLETIHKLTNYAYEGKKGRNKEREREREEKEY